MIVDLPGANVPGTSDVQDCHSIDLLIAYCRHRSGYVREAAVKRAAELALPDLLPVLAERLNDWVAPVRRRAADTVLAILRGLDPSTEAEMAFQVFLAVQHLRLTRRSDHSAFIAAFERSFIDLMGGQRIVDRISRRDARIARACFFLAQAHGLADQSTLCRLALAVRGDVVLARAALDIIPGLPGDARRQAYQVALASHSGTVRVAALRALLAMDEDGGVDLARAMLFDVNGWVRLVAASCLARHGVDVPAIYAKRLASADVNGRTLRTGLAGMAESGGRTHLDLVRRLTGYGQAQVQEAAFLAWMQLSPDEKDEIAQAALRSPFRRVRKLALAFLRKRGAFVPADAVLSQLRERGDVDLMLVFAKSDPWTWLAVIAELAADPCAGSDLRTKLRSELKERLGATAQCYSAPTPRQRDFLRDAGTRTTLAGLLGTGDARMKILDWELRTL